MLCKNCGCEIPNESIYCLKCGYKVLEDVAKVNTEPCEIEEESAFAENKPECKHPGLFSASKR